MHDCNPVTASAAAPTKPGGGGAWNGEVYRTFYEQNCSRDALCWVVDLDHGLGIIVPSHKNVMRPATLGITLKYFMANRDVCLSLTPIAESLRTITKLCTPQSSKS